MTSEEGGGHPYAKAYEGAGQGRDDTSWLPFPDLDARTGPTPEPDDAARRLAADTVRVEDDLADDTPPPAQVPDHKRGQNPPGSGTGGGSYKISRAALVLIALALGLGLLVGRVSVATSSSSAPPPARPSPTQAAIPIGPRALQKTGALCAIQRGNLLTLGVEVRNVTTGPVILESLAVRVPKGLSVSTTGVGACGELNVPNLHELGLAPEGSVWLSATLEVAVACPAADPVAMTVSAQDETGRAQQIAVGGFTNLQQVGWSGCTASARPSTAVGTTGARTSAAKQHTAKSPSSKRPSRP